MFPGGHEWKQEEKFVNTGYGTYLGTGNVETGAEHEKGTGYDEHGNVKTEFGHWKINHDPLTGTVVYPHEDNAARHDDSKSKHGTEEGKAKKREKEGQDT